MKIEEKSIFINNYLTITKCKKKILIFLFKNGTIFIIVQAFIQYNYYIQIKNLIKLNTRDVLMKNVKYIINYFTQCPI